MKGIKILVAILFSIVIGSLIWAFFLPKTLHIEEKTIIKAPIDSVFNQVNDLNNWKNWSQWKDDKFSIRYNEIEKGLGSKMSWKDEKEGDCTLEIIESSENNLITTELICNENKAKSFFKFKQVGEGTEISWSMDVNDLTYPFGRFVGYMIEKGAHNNFSTSLKKMKENLEKK